MFHVKRFSVQENETRIAKGALEIMIDAIISLALSLQSNKGAYALLLGSGVSRSAQIPTGWEIVEDLVRKIANLQNEVCDEPPSDWFLKKFGSAPSYSKLIADIAKTPSERNRLLRSYFEPTVEEREKGIKAPTKAHKAIAWLVAEGYVRVIITTNFDRLLESALDAQGVTPTVLTTPDAIQGALPLTLNSCCIVKVHGDYLDTRIRNTPEELAQYDKRLDKFLDRIFDDFGLIVCGWSAEGI
jgi:SIR2-like domain